MTDVVFIPVDIDRISNPDYENERILATVSVPCLFMCYVLTYTCSSNLLTMHLPKQIRNTVAVCNRVVHLLVIKQYARANTVVTRFIGMSMLYLLLFASLP